ncbi:MAG: hypothetical protein M0P71_18485 [Melioribacteraceae bacterium]|nr:hypothetical protein [Melioribacteraceae bacterium]
MARPKTKKIVSAASPINEELSAYGKGFQVATASYDDAATIKQVKASIAAPTSSMRENIASVIPPTAQYNNIIEGSVAPYPHGSNASYAGGYGANWSSVGSVWINTAFQLLQAAYTHIPKLTTTINLLTELCVGNILLRGGSAQSRSFFNNWLEKINIFNLQSEYYLEDWRSGNMFFYKLRSTLNKNTVKEFNQAFGAEITPGKKLTIKYLLLNPSSLGVTGITTFLNPTYYVVLNAFTLNTIFNDPSEATQKLIEQVPELKHAYKSYKSQKNIPGMMVVNLPLTPENLIACFQKKQDYEALSVPTFFGLISLFESQLEIMKLDMQINRQVLRATLLITMGSETLGAPSSRQIKNMNQLFQTDSIASVIVGDYTIKGQWLVPDIGELFDPKKYENLDKLIDAGLGNVLLGDSKFSSASSKLDVFVHKINYHRKAFLNNFLIPEMQNIAEEFGFKDIPVPEYAPLVLKENAVRERIVAQMAQLGLLTADETITALETGILPDRAESIRDQKEYKTDRDGGLYAPLLGKPQEDGGRPAGTPAKQTTQKISPAGHVGASKKASPETLRDTLLAATNLEKKLEIWAKKQYNIKKLNKDQQELVGSIVEQIVINEPKSKWEDVIAEYVDISKKINKSEIAAEISKMAVNFGLSEYPAALLYHSLFEVEEK